jgi:hypothetical protein
MAGAAKRKGDLAEREVAALLCDHLGLPCRRKLGAGRADDTGDIDGIPGVVVQVASWADALRAVREKPVDADKQAANAGAALAATFVRLRGGTYRVVMTPEMFAAWVREVLS